ncbi:MAG: bifunctional demethylmenaquinone methyltransferase/2-methoxy-6-polyprenyl-1,4-benzoquinol methylase UbiE [Bacteroidales bacterium]|nr:bifunctional demethylmenaquinone methyltransferase/2-methoxy-6-polyprenyl-1,4-benzoquinol methylase UbiE [Bacteroidales bacterium]
MPAKAKIKEMFDGIAADYDKLNHVLSLDVDKSWRRRALSVILSDAKDLSVLDLACGTGDFSIAIAKTQPEARVTGVDLSEGMLEVMKEKVGKLGLQDRIAIETGDGENLRFPDDSFDRVTNAFGIRNFEDKAKGLKEALRVLKPGGRLVILELSRPENKVLRWFYDLYFMNILPKIGGKVSGDKGAYSYLPASVKNFPGRKEFCKMMSDAGFDGVTHRSFTFGICRMYTGEKPR